MARRLLEPPERSLFRSACFQRDCSCECQRITLAFIRKPSAWACLLRQAAVSPPGDGNIPKHAAHAGDPVELIHNPPRVAGLASTVNSFRLALVNRDIDY